MNKRKAVAKMALLTLLAYPYSLYAIKTTEQTNKIEITFEQNEQYTDIDTGRGNYERNRATIEKTVSSTFRKAAAKYLPKGYKVEVAISDIDLAGDRSPLTSTYSDYRVLGESYPPRIKFSYSVYDPQERLIASGQESLTDSSYANNLRGARNLSAEEAPYVAELVRGWASTELRRAVKR